MTVMCCMQIYGMFHLTQQAERTNQSYLLEEDGRWIRTKEVCIIRKTGYTQQQKLEILNVLLLEHGHT